MKLPSIAASAITRLYVLDNKACSQPSLLSLGLLPGSLHIACASTCNKQIPGGRLFHPADTIIHYAQLCATASTHPQPQCHLEPMLPSPRYGSSLALLLCRSNSASALGPLFDEGLGSCCSVKAVFLLHCVARYDRQGGCIICGSPFAAMSIMHSMG